MSLEVTEIPIELQANQIQEIKILKQQKYFITLGTMFLSLP